MTYETALDHLADAYEGYLEAEGLLPATPDISRQFLDEMMQQHPD